MQLWFFDELDELLAFYAKFAKARGRVYAEYRADLAMAQMIIEFGAEIGVGQPVAIGYRVMLCIAEIARDSPRDPPAGHRQLTGIGEGDLPVTGMIDAVHFDRVGLQLDSDVAVPGIEIQKVVADDLALVAHAQHEAAKAKAGIVFHDVEKDRIRADRYHWLWPKFGHLLEPGAETVAQDEDRISAIFNCTPNPHIGRTADRPRLRVLSQTRRSRKKWGPRALKGIDRTPQLAHAALTASCFVGCAKADTQTLLGRSHV